MPIDAPVTTANGRTVEFMGAWRKHALPGPEAVTYANPTADCWFLRLASLCRSGIIAVNRKDREPSTIPQLPGVFLPQNQVLDAGA